MKVEININDKLVNLTKKYLSGKRLVAVAAVFMIASSIMLYSAVTIPYTFSEGGVISAEQVNANFKALKDKLDIVEANAQGVPIGTIVPFAGISSKVPTGWLLCDGSAVSRVDYATLFSTVQVNWGDGDEINTFNVPDLRGVVLRGASKVGASVRSDGYEDPDFDSREYLSGGSNVDLVEGVEERIGSFQMDENKEHIHQSTTKQTNFGGANFTTVTGGGDTSLAVTYGLTWGNSAWDTSETGGNESRSKNAAIHYIIKY